MSNEIKPIKRSKELAPLSREHHEGLLLGWKINQGLKNGTDHQLIAQYIQRFWDNELSDHFKKEEQVLAIHLPPNNVLVIKMVADHEEIEALIRVIAMIPDEAAFTQLAEVLSNHIRFEERELFPFAEKAIAAETLAAIQQVLEEKKAVLKWDNEFWIRK